jgi:preprotein translocase subunit SecD
MAQESFHEVIGFDFDGIVVSAPVIEPNQATFLSFGSSIQTPLGHQEALAKTIAAALDSGPLPVPLAAGKVRSK